MEAASQLLSVTREQGTRLSSKSRAEQYRSCRIGRKTECVINCLIITGKGRERMEWHRDLSFTNSSVKGHHIFQRTDFRG